MHIQKIEIKFIPHENQRYDTAGDYFRNTDGDLMVRVSKDKDWKREWGIMLHELFEVGILMARDKELKSINAIDKFDKEYLGFEPGMNPHAPYHREHLLAAEAEELFYEAVQYKGE
jgi:hypothetical protein